MDRYLAGRYVADGYVADGYVARTVAGTVVIVLICFVTLTASFALVEEVREEEAAYGFGDAFAYVAHTLPRRVHELVPFVVFLGVLIGLGALSGSSEVTVLRAAGMSLWRLYVPVAVVVVVASGIAFVVGEHVAPRLEARGELLRAQAVHDSETIYLAGYWHREGPLYSHVEGLGGADRALGVTQFELDDAGRLRELRRAEYATHDGADGGWRLHNVHATRLSDDRTATAHFDELPWRATADLRLLSARALVDPRKLSIADLTFQVDYMEREGQNAGRYRLAFWSKLLQPLATLGLALVAVGCVVGPLRETGMGTRIAAGIVVGLFFKYLQDLLAPASLVFGIPPWLAVAIPIAVCWTAGAGLLRRAA